jgi:thiol-disulfide isomerase/thioredoxin
MKKRSVIFCALVLAVLVMIYTGKPAEAGDFKKPVPVENIQEDLARCLVEKGWVLYSSSTCSACRAQMGLFGKTSKTLKVVECNPHVPENQVDLCLKKKIRKTPTWILDKNGKEIKRLEGYRSVEEIVSFSGCGM